MKNPFEPTNVGLKKEEDIFKHLYDVKKVPYKKDDMYQLKKLLKYARFNFTKPNRNYYGGGGRRIVVILR